MQTSISDKYLDTAQGQKANSILRSCVHCGFCTATCPTYQLLGDELDGPRGRIYLIKQVLEGNQVTRKTQQHLDRCLTCRSCETTCPSGVNYSKLLDIGRNIIEQKISRPWHQQLVRYLLRKIIPDQKRFVFLLKLAKWPRKLLPLNIARKIPQINKPQLPAFIEQENCQRSMILLESCGQASVTPNTNLASKIILQRLGIQLKTHSKAGCCGAVSHHLSAEEEALNAIKHNIDVWWPLIENGAEAIVVTASGCGAMVKDYAELLADNPDYADKAKRVSQLAKDISEILANEDLNQLIPLQATDRKYQHVAFHSPCTLQHGQKLTGIVEPILTQLGYTLTHVSDSHLCCGSAGTYSFLQPALSQKLLDNKLKSLTSEQAEVIVTANIGCQMHMASKAQVPVKHWIELLV